MADEVERKILDMVEQGQISAEEALRLLNASSSKEKSLQNAGFAVPGAIEAPESENMRSFPKIPEAEMKRMEALKRWWVLPFGIGLLITTLGAIWMYSGYLARGFGLGFWLAWVPFLLGIFVVAVSFQTSRSVWLHVRVRQKPGETPQRIAISLPMPVMFTRWFLATFSRRIPGLKDQPTDEYSEILNNLSPEEPFYVHVNDENGEEVEVFIG